MNWYSAASRYNDPPEVPPSHADVKNQNSFCHDFAQWLSQRQKWSSKRAKLEISKDHSSGGWKYTFNLYEYGYIYVDIWWNLTDKVKICHKTYMQRNFREHTFDIGTPFETIENVLNEAVKVEQEKENKDKVKQVEEQFGNIELQGAIEAELTEEQIEKKYVEIKEGWHGDLDITFQNPTQKNKRGVVVGTLPFVAKKLKSHKDKYTVKIKKGEIKMTRKELEEFVKNVAKSFRDFQE